MRVLVADDSPVLREELSAFLSHEGHFSAPVPTGAKALEILKHEEFDVVIADLTMPRKSGLELLREVRQRYPRTLVVVITGFATVDVALEAMRLGAFDYLRKPIQPDQVRRVLDLVGQQLALTRAGATPLDPVQYATALASEDGYEVLLISPPPAEVTTEKVVHIPLDAENPFRIREAVEDFVGPRERAAVVLAAVEQLLARHREEEIAALLEGIRAILEGKGPLAVGYDPKRITATGALAVRASIVSAEAGATLDSLANPIRRLVLRRLAEGPCSFTQTLEAAHLDDTSLISFHLRNLTESGLVTHVARERYELTPRGQGAIKILSSIDELDSGKGSGNRVFASTSTANVAS